jgi:hypothetical protein
MNLNANQVVAIALVILGVFVASTAQLTDLFGAMAAKYIVSFSGLLMSILSGILGVMTGQSSQVKAVQAMPGVEKIVVNAQANETLATLAVDPAQAKIEALPSAQAAVNKTAQG